MTEPPSANGSPTSATGHGERTAAVCDVIHVPSFFEEPFVVAAVSVVGSTVVYRVQPATRPLQPFRLETFLEVDDRDAFEGRTAILARLGGHPNLTEVVWFGTWRDAPAVVGKWYRKLLDHAWIASRDDDTVAAAFGGVVAGLAYAFERDVLHGGIAPAVICLDLDDRPRIGGFLAAGEGSSVVSPYTAPDFAPGRGPSLPADLYALGVVFGELLTGTPPTGASDPSLSARPRFRDLLERLLADDPSRRPATYAEVFALLGLSENALASPDAAGIVAGALYLRRQGRVPEAIAAVRAGLERFPDDPVLWNALAVNEPDAPDAEPALWRAVELLRATGGVRDGKLYLDPVMNLVWIPLLDRRFEEAAALLRDARAWAKGDEVPLQHYLEFAWLDLWEGRAKRATEFLARELPDRGGFPVHVAHWFLLAARLTGRPDRYAEELASALVPYASHPMHGLLAAVVGRWMNPEMARALY